ncbi:MAG: 50S ribosomal protein L22 [Firmicutes bacterium]|nr:50S ribosomal protein L22 [Bacillota bacterium]
MEAKAKANYIRIAPRKVREVIDLIRNKPVNEARAILSYNQRRAARTINKILNSAVANAENNFDMNQHNLYVAEAYVDEGPIMKRVRPRARGRRHLIRKRTSHITMVLKEEGEEV